MEKDSLKLVSWRWGNDSLPSIVGKAENTSNETYDSTYIEFKIYDKQGNFIGEANDFVRNLGPHETWAFKCDAPPEAHHADFVKLYGNFK